MLIIRNALLDGFEATARLGTVHAAADELNVTQAAVTQRIKALETGLGLTLFLRSRKGMALTDEGRALLRHCSASRELEGRFLGAVGGIAREEPSLTIVGPTSAVSSRIARDIESLYSKFPFLRLHLQSDDHSNRIEMIRRGEADLAVVPPHQVPNEMTSKVLKADRYLLVASRKWKNRRLSEVLEKERMIDFEASDETSHRYLKQYGLKASRERLFVNENQALIRFVCAGIGFATLTESIAAPYIENGSLMALNRGATFDDPLALAWYPRTQKSDYFSEVVRSIK